ncbi:MAG: HU family DNA-binding protein [bacterium]|nr:HU family DNA-binding protein [bacterium]
MDTEYIIKRISAETGLKKKRSEQIFSKVLEVLSKELKDKKDMSIKDFGYFSIVHEKMKVKLKGDKIKTVTPPGNKVSFTPSDYLESRINE